MKKWKWKYENGLKFNMSGYEPKASGSYIVEGNRNDAATVRPVDIVNCNQSGASCITRQQKVSRQVTGSRFWLPWLQAKLLELLWTRHDTLFK